LKAVVGGDFAFFNINGNHNKLGLWMHISTELILNM